MAKVSPSFEIRQALTSDYDDVMKISEGLYSGMDIIPSVFHEYVTDPCRIFYVAIDRKTGVLVRFTRFSARLLRLVTVLSGVFRWNPHH